MSAQTVKSKFLSLTKKADLILTLFEMCTEEGKEVDKATIVRLVRLAA